MADASTLSLGDTPDPNMGAVGDEALALVIAWSASEPARVGEVAFLEPPGSVRRFGRGAPPAGGGWLRFGRQRPGAFEPTGPVEGPAISREQLRIQVRDGSLLITRAGRCPMLVKGQMIDRAVLGPGETILLKGQLLLLCVARPVSMPPLRDFEAGALGPFGGPDSLGVLGESPAAFHLRDAIAFVASAEGHVLVSGASGSGKELVARAVHALSRRAGGPFVARNAATLPPGLVDAELFGSARNYPHPGLPERPGLIGQAQGGTLFLDEIGELSHELQAHFLRVLDAGEYHRLGEAVGRRADVRLVAATNRAPEELKHDLLARLLLRLDVPDLNDRREDVPLLARHLLRRARVQSPSVGDRFFAGDEPRVDVELVDHLIRHPYTTHVRELERLLWRAMTTSPGGVITRPAEPQERPTTPARDVAPTAEEILRAVEEHGGNLASAARALGLPSRYALYRLLRRHGIEVDSLR
jgi:two-component system nitrogen regulation response regulator GlnG/two-component system response regulator HydG